MEEIKAFGKALEALLKLFAMALRSALNHGEIAWEDFTDFLEDNGW